MGIRFEHMVSTHLSGRYYTMRSEGLESGLENKCLSVVPALQSHSFINTNSCLYQKVVSDKFIMVGKSENAVDDYDGRSFVNHHIIVIQYEDYIHFNLHPELFQKEFLTYEDIKKQLVMPDKDPLSLKLEPLHPSLECIPDLSSIEKLLKDKDELAVLLDSLILASLEKNRVTVDFTTMEEASSLLMATLWIIPKQIRVLVPFCVGTKPDNDKQLDLYRVILRVWPEIAYPLSGVRHAETFKISQSIAKFRHSKNEIDELHRTFDEIYRVLKASEPNLGSQELIKRALEVYQKRGGGGEPELADTDVLGWLRSMASGSKKTKPPDIDEFYLHFITLDPTLRGEYLRELDEVIKEILGDDMIKELELLSTSASDSSIFCILPDLLMKLATIRDTHMDTQSVSSLAADYMFALNRAMTTQKPFSVKDLSPSYFPFRFRIESEPLLKAINNHLLKRIASLKEIGCRNSIFLKRYDYFKKSLGELQKQRIRRL